MTTLKRIAILYFSSLLAFIIIGKISGGEIFSMLKSIGLWIVPLMIITVGQIIGSVVSLALEKPHLKQKVFNISYLITFLGFVAMISYFKYSSWQHNKDFGNIEANQAHFIYFGGQYKVQEKTAFDSLTKLLINPNSFKLTGGSVKSIDTVMNGFTDTIYLTTLHYKKKNQEPIFKAKFAVFRDSAQLIYYDIPLDHEDNQRIDSLDKVVIKNFNDAMKRVPDTFKKTIRKDFKDIMDN